METKLSMSDTVIIKDKDDIEIKAQIKAFVGIKYSFNGFYEGFAAKDEELSLRVLETVPENKEKKYVPAYKLGIFLNDKEQVGKIDLRVGYVEGLYYGGNIGYEIFNNFRGRNYAKRACEMLIKLAKMHDMPLVCITNDVNNLSSKRVCEKLGASLVASVNLPEDNPLSFDMQAVNIFYKEV